MVVVYIVLALIFILLMSVLITDAIKIEQQLKRRKDEINNTTHHKLI